MSNAVASLTEVLKNASDGDRTARLVLEHPIMHTVLKELTESAVPIYIRFDVPAARIIVKESKRRIIHGYASVEVIDKDNELITLKALGNALQRLKEAGEQYANVNLEHSNITIGKILLNERVKSSDSTEYWTHVDDRGLYVVCELRDDLEIANLVWDMIEREELNAFSIGGRALNRSLISQKGNTHLEITDLELYELTVCKRGKNRLSRFEILKSYRDLGLLDENSFIQKADELKKSEEIVKELMFLPHFMGKSFVLRKDFICQVGSTAEKSEGHDFDLLVKLDPDNELRRHVETRLLKALPDDLWDKIEFVFGDLGGPHDAYRPLYDLALVPTNPHLVEMTKGEILPDEQSAIHQDIILKNINDAATSEDKELSTINKVETSNLVGTATGPQSGGMTGTSTEGPAIAGARKKVKDAQNALKQAEDELKAAGGKPEEEDKGKPKDEDDKEKARAGKYPYPDEDGKKKVKDEEDTEKAGKGKYPYPDEDGKKKPKDEAEKSDEEVAAVLEDFEAKGKLPEGLRRWLAERRKKSDPLVAIAALEAKVDEKFDALAKSLENLTKAELIKVDEDTLAKKVVEILKGGEKVVKKAEATQQVTPGAEPVVTGPKTLAEMHATPWNQLHELSDRRLSERGA